ncbi:hypothetical protein OROGR_008176 [Orobanche gracilis]
MTLVLPRWFDGRFASKIRKVRFQERHVFGLKKGFEIRDENLRIPVPVRLDLCGFRSGFTIEGNM